MLRSALAACVLALVSALPVAEAQAKAPAAVAPTASPTLFAETVSGKVGAPQPIVLIPGLSAPAAAWDLVRPELEKTHEVRSLTLAGMGGAAPQSWAGNFVEAEAKAIVAHLRGKGVKGATLIGHSIGGGVALLAALEGPDVVGRVVLVDSLPFTAAWLSGGQVQTPEQAETMANALQAAMGSGAWSDIVARNRPGLPIQSRDEDFHSQLQAWLLASDQSTIAAAMGDLLRLDLRPRLAGLSQPILSLIAYDDGVTPLPRETMLAAAKQQFSQAPRVEVRLVEGSRHWIQHDQPAALLAAIQGFLAP